MIMPPSPMHPLRCPPSAPRLSPHDALRGSSRPAVWLSAVLIAAAGGVQAATVAGVTPGTFSVDRTGAAVYSVPVEVPPGTAGMEPSLSIVVVSRGSDGLLGVGGALEGLSSIGRCAKTRAQDGKPGSVDYGTDDRFCLDGQRLVAVNGSYGADGTEYRTEIDTFARIVSRGSAGGGPERFEVWTESGQRMEYGATPDSRVEVENRTQVRQWAVGRVEDSVGNYLTVSYLETDGYAYPDRIDYAGHAGVAPHASVRFTYEMRHAPRIVFQGGSSIRMDRRLAAIETYEGTSRISQFRLSYGSQGLPQRTRLTGIERCDGAGDCFPGIDLSWNAAGEGELGSALYSRPGTSGNFAYYRPVAGDFNGDGVSDLAWVRQLSSGVRAYVALGDGDGTFATTQASTPTGSGNYASYEPLTGDFNGDGVSDVVWAHESSAGVKVLTALSNGDGTFAAAQLSTPADTGDYASHAPLIGDFDGNGISDLAWAHEHDAGVEALVALSNGDGTFASAQLSTPADTGDYDAYQPLAGDFDADGVSDLAWVDESNAGVEALVALSNGDGTFAAAQLATPTDTGDYGSYEPSAGDFNADGVSDLAWSRAWSGGLAVLVSLGEGDGTFAAAQLSTPKATGSYTSYKPQAGDFNGDGILDLAWVYRGSGGLRSLVALGEGDGTLAEAQLSTPKTSGDYRYYTPMAGDFDGDGVSDLAWTYQWTSGLRVYASLATVPADAGQVASIRPRLGADIVIDYARLTEAGAYIKDTGEDGCAYPCVDIRAPLSVVVRVETGNGIGGWNRATYAYGGAKSDLSGRGFLGFRWMNVKDEQTGIYTTTEYLQRNPFIGQVEYTRRYVSDGSDTNISTTRNTWSASALNAGRTRFPYVSRSVTDNYELEDGANNRPVTTVTTTSVYDGYGNPTSMTETTTGLGRTLAGRPADSFTKTTTNSYANDTVRWHLGRLQCAKGARGGAVGQSAQTRTSGFAYDAASGLLAKEVVEPRTGDIAGCVSAAANSDATLSRVTTYTHDRFGNRTTATASGVGVANRAPRPRRGGSVRARAPSPTTGASRSR